jgi:cysteine dioxygenase
MFTPIDEVLTILKGVPASAFEPEHIETLLAGVAVEERSLAPYLHFARGRYTRNLIFRDQTFELLALCWDEGSYSPIHNHSGQDCWFLVQQGQFCLEGYRAVEGGDCPGRACLEHVDSLHKVGAGALDHRGPLRDIHQVKVSRGTARAISIHLYAKPFDDCLIYDLKQSECRRQPLKYHSIEGRLV